mgnify:CR=1 FL=1
MGIRTSSLSFILGMGMLLAGCGSLNGAAPEERSLDLAVLHKGSQCGASTPAPGAFWIDRPQDLPPALGRPGRQALPEGLQWNAESEGALWIHMGAQPTGGYGLELTNPAASVREGMATVQITWRRPAPDRFVTQAFTSPCLLLKMPKAGIKSILVVDQEGRQRLLVELP